MIYEDFKSAFIIFSFTVVLSHIVVHVRCMCLIVCCSYIEIYSMKLCGLLNNDLHVEICHINLSDSIDMYTCICAFIYQRKDSVFEFLKFTKKFQNTAILS